jgi:hypothetical protein
MNSNKKTIINKIKINTFKDIIEDLNKAGFLKNITNNNKLKLNIQTNDDIKTEVDKNIALCNELIKNIPPPNNNNKNMKTYLNILANPK